MIIFGKMLLRIFIFLFPFYGFCQGQYRFSHFTIKDGLPQNTVHCTFKDSEGYYWFGTQDGLCRYDGYSVKIFRHNRDDSATISDNFILAIAEDKFKNLWIGTRNGMNCFDRKTEKFRTIIVNEEEKTYYHNSIWFVSAEDENSMVFRNSFSQLVKIPVEEKKTEIIDSNNIILAISADIYCRQMADTVTFYSAQGTRKLLTAHITDTSLYEITSLCQKPSGEILAGTGQGLFVLARNKPVQHFCPELKNKRINVLLYDSKGNLWAGTSSGLYIINEDRNSFPALLKHVAEDAGSLSGNSVQSIYEDPDGLIWVGTAEGGVNIYDPQKDVFRIFHRSTSVSLSGNPVYGIYQEANELWLGTSSGLNHFVMENGNISGLYSGENKILKSEILAGNGSRSDSIGGNFITAIARDKNGSLWFGSQGNGISIYQPGIKKWEHLDKKNSPLKTNTIFHIMCASDGVMWISTNSGCYRYTPAGTGYYPPGRLDLLTMNYGYIFSVYEDKGGNIWVGTTYGMARFNRNGKMVAEYFSSDSDKNSLSYNMTTSFFEDSRGNFWVATLGGGLNLMNRDKGAFKAFTKKDGLANDVVYCILEDKNGKIWLSTNAGLSCFDIKKRHFTNYSEKDGAVSKEFIQNSAFITSGGELLFGSPEGMLAFHPGKINFQERKIPLVLTSLKINYEERNFFPGEEIELSPGDKTISFEFSAPDFRNQHQVFYSFMMEGFEKEWHDAPSNNRIASYTNLPFGEYTFRIRIRMGNNDWQQKQLSIKTRVIPPIWMKGWFIALEILLALSTIVLTVKYYSQRKLRKRLHEVEMLQKIHIEKERISRDLHDNVGSNLTYITTTLDNISHKIGRDEKELSRDKISSLSDFTRSTMQQLRETIWAINKESVLLSDFKDKVNEHLSKMLSNENNINYAVKLKGEDEVQLKPADAIHLFRIVQESVNNCIKHSGAKNISFEISGSKNKNVTVIISDDGKGFDKSLDVNGHYGLENMQARVREMGGTFELNSEIGKGTGIIISLPL